MRVAVDSLLRTAVVLCCLAASRADEVACAASRTQSKPLNESRRYDELVKEGERQMTKGNYLRAEVSFEAAAAVELFEEPNYIVLLKLAEVRCYLGKVSQALAMLTDFRCMMYVDSGQKPCFEGSGPGVLGTRNAELSNECFQRMCSEMYLPYYEAPTSSKLRIIKKLGQEANRIETICKKMSEEPNH